MKVILFVIAFLFVSNAEANQCDRYYRKYMIRYMKTHKSTNNTVVIQHVIDKLALATGKPKLYLANCLGIVNENNKDKFT
jgi:hypothetical protein